MGHERDQHLERMAGMLRRLFWLGHQQTVATMESVGLTLGQAMVLLALESTDGRSTMSALGRLIQVTPATMTGIVDRLIALDLVIRERDEADRRVVNVAITPAGLERVAAINARRDADMATLMVALSDAEVGQLAAMVDRLLAGMEEQLGGPA